MVDTRMSVVERETFLADIHVGVLSVPRREGSAPLTVPVWYDYSPGSEVWLITGQQSLKGQLLEVGSSVALVAQTEDTPYKYVSVEGCVRKLEPTSNESDLKPMAIRYLGEKKGIAYAVCSNEVASIRVSIQPERWFTVDYAKT